MAETAPLPLFEDLRHPSLSDRVRESVIEAITSGKLKPHDGLPSERELAKQFGVSRIVIREALRSLEITGWVNVYRGRGAFVSETPGQALEQVWKEWFSRHRHEIVELLKVRQALEVLAAREAALNASSGDIDRISDVNSSFADEVGSGRLIPETLVDLDVRFHHLIAAAAHSDLLMRLIDELAVVLIEARRALLAYPGRHALSAADHEAILAAIRARDGDAAAAAMSLHMGAIIELSASLIADVAADDPDTRILSSRTRGT